MEPTPDRETPGPAEPLRTGPSVPFDGSCLEAAVAFVAGAVMAGLFSLTAGLWLGLLCSAAVTGLILAVERPRTRAALAYGIGAGCGWLVAALVLLMVQAVLEDVEEESTLAPRAESPRFALASEDEYVRAL